MYTLFLLDGQDIRFDEQREKWKIRRKKKKLLKHFRLFFYIKGKGIYTNVRDWLFVLSCESNVPSSTI